MTMTSSNESLLQTLERFNRKERFIVFQQATSEGAVTLTETFRKRLGSELSWDVPEDVVVLLDYHLNWLYAALERYAGTWASRGTEYKAHNDVPSIPVTVDDERVTRSAIERNQEDIDLLIAWESSDTTHLGLIEVKAHSSWSNRQMKSKAARLEAIFGDNGAAYAKHNVVPHFALMSFSAPKGIDTGEWPQWMKSDSTVAYLPIKLSGSRPRLTVGQVDETGKASKQGGYYAIQEVNV